MHRDQRHIQAVLLAKRHDNGRKQGPIGERDDNVLSRHPIPVHVDTDPAVRNRIARYYRRKAPRPTSASAEPTPSGSRHLRSRPASPVAIRCPDHIARNPRTNPSINHGYRVPHHANWLFTTEQTPSATLGHEDTRANIRSCAHEMPTVPGPPPGPKGGSSSSARTARRWAG